MGGTRASIYCPGVRSVSGPFLGDGLTRREQSPNFAGTPKQLRFILSNLQVVLEGGLNLFLGKRGEGLLLVMGLSSSVLCMGF